MLSNREISRQLSLYAELLVLHEKDERLSRILGAAAYNVRRVAEDLGTLTPAELRVAGLRPEVVKVVDELRSRGTIEELDELIQLTPSGLFEMMRIKGLGGKKLHALWHLAKIDNVTDLLAACKAGTLRIPGFGIKTQQNIVQAIEAMNERTTHFHYASVAAAAASLVDRLQAILQTRLVSLCGAVRREATTVECIEVLAAVRPQQLKAAGVRRVLIVEVADCAVSRAHTPDEIPVLVYHTTAAKYYEDLFLRTGNPEHTQKVLERIEVPATYRSEKAIYRKAGLPFVVPAMREDVAEWNFTALVSDLVTPADIRGVVHNHTDWSDGVDTLEAFVGGCRKKGFEYCVISDHSKNAHYAGGLKEPEVLQQLAAIDALNRQVHPFKIFKSIECDIRVSGELDYDSDLLAQFDLVIVSIHQLLKMDREKATNRLLKAIENPYTTILGHMTGRQLLVRPGYPVDVKKVIDACAAHGVVIELNANPYRLDMDWSHIPYAVEKGVMISINPDAHSIPEIDNICWGVSAARKGGLTRAMTWNALPLPEIEAWLSRRRRGHQPAPKHRHSSI